MDEAFFSGAEIPDEDGRNSSIGDVDTRNSRIARESISDRFLSEELEYTEDDREKMIEECR